MKALIMFTICVNIFGASCSLLLLINGLVLENDSYTLNGTILLLLNIVLLFWNVYNYDQLKSKK